MEDWSNANKLQLNADKCKELRIDFKRPKEQFDALNVNSKEPEQVDSIKLLGVTVSNTLKWNCHVSELIEKTNKRMYFLTLLKRAKVPTSDIVSFYTTCIRPALEYCAPLYHNALPDYLGNDIEGVQKHALSIISPALSNHDLLQSFKLETLKVRRNDHCQKLFNQAVS